jgi:hypothetical protein
VRRLTLLLTLFLMLLPGAAVLAANEEEGSIQLGIEPVDTEHHFFDISLEPGESTKLTVRFFNHGEVGTDVTVFAADVYTMRGGGMGMAEIGDARTGATEWLDFEDREFPLEPGESVEQVFAVSVPEETPPGDYITAVVIQNTDPVDISNADGPSEQTVRQGVAVAIDVPGERQPGLEFNGLSHDRSGERSVVEVDIENSGNTHLRPSGTFEFQNVEGEVLADSSVTLDTVYAGTSTVLEVNFTDFLPPGEYRISMSLQDEETGATVSVEGLELSIAAPEPTPEPEAEDQDDGGLIGAIRSSDSVASDNPILLVTVFGGAALLGVMIIIAVVLANRSARKHAPPRQPIRLPPRRPQMRQRDPGRSPQSGQPSIRQLSPRKRGS